MIRERESEKGALAQKWGQTLCHHDDDEHTQRTNQSRNQSTYRKDEDRNAKRQRGQSVGISESFLEAVALHDDDNGLVGVAHC